MLMMIRAQDIREAIKRLGKGVRESINPFY